jgi:L-methionine (R)-S-oxide reductase
MPENLTQLNSDASKEERYQNLLHQIECLIKNEINLVANLANISAALKTTFNFLWVGFYLIDAPSKLNELVLGPFQVLIS